MAEAVIVENLTKIFPRVKSSNLGLFRLPFARPGKCVLAEASFEVAPGEVLGLVGPNGAGKTTLLKILCTLLAPSAGRAAVQGFDVVRQGAAARRQLGYCPGFERSFYLRLSGRENLRFYDSLARDVLGRSPKHVMLLHENDLNALFLDDFVAFIKQRGAKIIPISEAYTDPISDPKWDAVPGSQRRVAAIAWSSGHRGSTWSPWVSESALGELFESGHWFTEATP